jgi:radical SAM protein with 4Fe4S-binding SPASM domain
MNKLSAPAKWWNSLLAKSANQPGQGIYHYNYAQEGEKSRIHLRVNPDGSGVLVVNANRVMHLNPTSAWICYHHLEGTPSDAIVQGISKTYTVDKKALKADVESTIHQVDEIIRPDGPCPIHDLVLETTMPFSTVVNAPYRMDLAITYRCNNDCLHCYNARARDYSECATDEWKQIISKVWELTIPHVVFTGGEPTLRNDLPELIRHAEATGLITGINTNGRRLANKDFLKSLVDAGLDHVQITLESHDSSIHEWMVHCTGAWRQTVQGIENALASNLFVMTNTTMLQANYQTMDQTLIFLAQLGVPTIGLNSLIYSGAGTTVGSGLREEELTPLLDLAKAHTEKAGQRLIWYTPTEYCRFDPVSQELGIKGCTAAYYNMCIEPDGSVIPCQSYYSTLGNLLKDPWESIWNHPLSLELRERRKVPTRCLGCSLLVECGGGCPLHRDEKTIFLNDSSLIPAAN